MLTELGGKNCEKQDLRPCIVNGKKALFHMFYQESFVVGESPLVCGHSAGQVSTAMALVEMPNGEMKFFCNKYCFYRQRK